jgi:hypothetical protein
MPLASAGRILVIFLLFLTLVDPVVSVTLGATLVPVPGFWAGLMDGFMSLPKLLVSPFVDVVLVDPGAHPLVYDIGFYAGVLLFAGAGAAAASSTTEPNGLAKNVQLSGEARKNR